MFMHPCNTTDVLPMAEPAFCKLRSVPLSHSSRDLSCKHCDNYSLAQVMLGCVKEIVGTKGAVQKMVVRD